MITCHAFTYHSRGKRRQSSHFEPLSANVQLLAYVRRHAELIGRITALEGDGQDKPERGNILFREVLSGGGRGVAGSCSAVMRAEVFSSSLT